MKRGVRMKCEYCDRMNTADTTVCKYCGAPLEKANMKQNFQSYKDDLPLDIILLTISGVVLFGIVLSLIPLIT